MRVGESERWGVWEGEWVWGESGIVSVGESESGGVSGGECGRESGHGGEQGCGVRVGERGESRRVSGGERRGSGG